MIPKQLQNPDFRFILIRKGTKKPFEEVLSVLKNVKKVRRGEWQ